MFHSRKEKKAAKRAQKQQLAMGQGQILHEGTIHIDRGNAAMPAAFIAPRQETVLVETVNVAPVQTLNTVNVVESSRNIIQEAPIVIRHDEQAVLRSNVAQATVITHTEAPIVKTIVEQPIIKNSHKEIVHEHHQQVVNELHKEVIHEHHRPVIHEHIQPVIYQEHIHEKHVPIIHEKQTEIIHEKHVPIVQESHQKRVTEEVRGAIVTESRAAPVVTKEIVAPIVQKEVLATQQMGALNLGTTANTGLIREEKIITERSSFGSNATTLGSSSLASSGLGHTHIDTYETDAYGVQKQGFGTKIKNAFRKMGRKNKNQEDIDETYIGPNGERVHEEYHYSESR